MADEPGEDAPLLEEPPEPEEGPPAAEEAPAPESAPVTEQPAPAEEALPTPAADENNPQDKSGEDEEECGEKRKRPGGGDKDKEATRARLLQGVLQFFLSCCMPVVSPGGADSRRSSMCDDDVLSTLPVHYSFITTFTIEAIADGFIIEKNACGRLGRFKSPNNDEVKNAFAAVEEGIKAKVTELKGQAPDSLHLEGYKEQKVVGLNFFVKVKIDNGPDFIHAKIYQPIDGEPCLIDTTTLKINSDDVEYF